MKRFFSVLLVLSMILTSIVACNQESPAVDPDDGQQDVIQPNENQGGEDDISEIPEDSNVQTLNLHLPPEKAPVAVETVEKVIKLSVSSSGDVTAKHIIIRVDPVEIPSDCTLQYDVYLENPAIGMGVFDMKINNGAFLSGDASKVDAAGIGLDVEVSDITSYAYGRWYHREFPLHNDGTSVSLSMVRFSAGGLSAGNTNVCYYDNIKVVDSEGNVVYEINENMVAETEVNESNGISCEFSLVDDPQPTSERLTSKEYLYIHEPMGTLTGSDKIDITFTIDNEVSAPAIYIGEQDDSCLYGVRGYILAANRNYLTLYRSAETVTELASKKILGLEPNAENAIRFELDGSIVRGYWLDDMEGVEPWPEFILAVEELSGKSYGFMDLFARGYTLKTISHGECDKSETENVFTNPVLDDFADPDVLLYDGVYYMYGTMGPGYKVYSSTDLVNWEYRGQCMENNFWGWENNGAYWAPDVEYYNGKFYMVCSINQHLGIAVADSPLGPFIADETYLFPSTIDGHLFIDDDGQAYLYYVSNRPGVEYGIYGAKFDLETLQVDLSTEVCVINDTEKWETYDDENMAHKSQVCEGPYMLKHNGLYYITYSGSDYKSIYYAVGYGVSESPLGPFEKYEGNPIHIGNSAVHGTAHHTFTTSPDGSQLYIVYHQHKNLNEVELRKISVDKARFSPTESGSDRIETYGPTTTAQPMPLG